MPPGSACRGRAIGPDTTRIERVDTDPHLAQKDGLASAVGNLGAGERCAISHHSAGLPGIGGRERPGNLIWSATSGTGRRAECAIVERRYQAGVRGIVAASVVLPVLDRGE